MPLFSEPSVPKATSYTHKQKQDGDLVRYLFKDKEYSNFATNEFFFPLL